jgi:hypothetical protein
MTPRGSWFRRLFPPFGFTSTTAPHSITILINTLIQTPVLFLKRVDD